MAQRLLAPTSASCRAFAIRTLPAARRPSLICSAAANTSIKEKAVDLLAINVTKATLRDNLGGSTTRNIDGNIYSVTYDAVTDSVKVVDRQRGLAYEGIVGDKDQRIKIDLSSPQQAAVDGPPSFEEMQRVLKGDGPGPEAINGRLAMVAFLACSAVEMATHQSVLEQAASPAGAAGAAALALATIAASLAPALVGKVSANKVFPDSNDSYPDQQLPYYFTPLAEAINGRLAMLGMAALVINEAFFRHGALF